MRSIILLDRSFAKREHDLLWRLEVGLADEGVRVVHAVPQAILAGENVGLFSRPVGYDDGGFPLARWIRAKGLAEGVARAVESDSDASVQVIHAFGVATWELALEAGKQLRSAVFLELWKSSTLSLAAELVRRAPRHGWPVPKFFVGDTALLAAASQRVPSANLISAPWGVHDRASDTEVLEEDRARGLAVLLDASSMSMVESMLQALSELRAGGKSFMLFVNVEASRSKSQTIWQLAKQFGLSDLFSMTPQAEARRAPILLMDALIIPEPSGKLRSISLEAMACGIPVIAAADPVVGSLIDGQTARLVHAPDPRAWAAAISQALDPRASSTLLASARAWVHEHCPASAYISSVLRAYDAAAKEVANTR